MIVKIPYLEKNTFLRFAVYRTSRFASTLHVAKDNFLPLLLLLESPFSRKKIQRELRMIVKIPYIVNQTLLQFDVPYLK